MRTAAELELTVVLTALKKHLQVSFVSKFLLQCQGVLCTVHLHSLLFETLIRLAPVPSVRRISFLLSYCEVWHK